MREPGAIRAEAAVHAVLALTSRHPGHFDPANLAQALCGTVDGLDSRSAVLGPEFQRAADRLVHALVEGGFLEFAEGGTLHLASAGQAALRVLDGIAGDEAMTVVHQPAEADP